jgi:hypothetical protein
MATVRFLPVRTFCKVAQDGTYAPLSSDGSCKIVGTPEQSRRDTNPAHFQSADLSSSRSGTLALIRRRNYRKSDCRLRGNVHADRYVFPVFLAIGDVGGRINFEFALNGRVLIDVEGH